MTTEVFIEQFTYIDLFSHTFIRSSNKDLSIEVFQEIHPERMLQELYYVKFPYPRFILVILRSRRAGKTLSSADTPAMGLP